MTIPTQATATRAEQHIQMLAELADLTMVLCRVAALRACEQLDPEQPPEQPQEQPQEHPQPETQDPAVSPHIRKPIHHDAPLAFARLSRALRQTIALEARIAAERDRAAAHKAAGITWRTHAPCPPELAKAHIAAAILDAATLDAVLPGDPAAPRRRDDPTLIRHVDERLDAHDVALAIDDDEDLATLVARMCKDLAIPFDPDDHPPHLALPLRAAIEAARHHRPRGAPLRYRLVPTPPPNPHPSHPHPTHGPPGRHAPA